MYRETMANRYISTDNLDEDRWFHPSPARIFSQTERKSREIAIQSRSWDWGNSLAKISADIDPENFEDMLDDIYDLSLSTEEKHKALKSIYPPQQSYRSSLLILQKDNTSEADNASFINVLRTAYSSDSAQTGVNTFRVNLVLKGLRVVHTFDFTDESDYWRFLSGVRKGNRGEMENYITGVCRMVGSHGEEDTGNRKLLGFSIGKLPKLTTPKDNSHEGQGRFVISHNILTFRHLGPKGQLSDDEEIINLMDVWAMALTSDLTTIQSHSFLLQADLPDILLKKGISLDDYEFQLMNNETMVPFPNTVHNLPVTVFPAANRPSIFAAVPTSYLGASQFLCRANQTQEILVKIVDAVHHVDIGQQSFVANNIVAEYKAHQERDSTFASSTTSGASSPKPNRRGSSISAVRFNNESDSSSANNNRSSYDFNSPTSNRGSGKMMVTDPIMKINAIQRVDTILMSKGGERALKLEIKRASGLITTGGKIPAVYCTIYLAGRNGQRLTSNVAEMRTEPVKSLDPEWNHEIIIHDERLAKEEVEFVMVLLRDQSSGVLKHRHVGQVMIPLSCFLDTSAEFCLPIEPSYRMDSSLSQTSFIGDIHLVTHMVRGEAVHRNSATNTNKDQHSKIFRVDSMRLTTFPLSFSMHRNAAGSTWWPMKLLVPPSSTAAISAAAMPANSANNRSNTGHGANLAVNIGGSTVITPTYFSGFLIPASEALLLSISNPLDFHYLPVTPTNNTLLHLEVLWSDVLDAEVLSDGAVFLKIQVSAQQQDIGSKVDPSSTNNPTSLDKKLVEFLVGPCPAVKLVQLIQRRKRFQELGQNMAAIQLFKSTVVLTSVESSHPPSVGGPNSPMNPVRSRTSSVSASRTSFFAVAGSATRLAANLTGTYGIVETIRDTAEIIESLYKDLNLIANSSLLAESTPETPLTEKDIIWEQVYLRYIDLYLRCKLVPLLLPHIPDSEDVPEFSIAYIQKAVEKDKNFYQMLIPLRVNEKMETLNERYDSFMEEIARRIRDFVIFSSRTMNDGAGPQYTTHGALAEPCDETDLPNEAKFCIEVLAEKYHEVLKQSLRPYVQSKQTFQAIQGQWLKNCVLKLLIEKNHQFEMVIATSLRVNGLYLLQNKHFELVENIDDVLDWFASTLLQDTRLWLSKTIDQARHKRENSFDLPWDTDVVGDRICSHLPESVSFQLKVFMDVCVKDFSKSRRIMDASAMLAAAAATSSTTNKTTNNNNNSNNAVNPELLKLDFYKVANEKLLQAISQAWILLSNEYERSLLSKHWDQARLKPEMDAYVDFLCAIANDCYRIRRDQVLALTDIRARDDRKLEILTNLHNRFRNLQTQAITFVMRIVYSTVQRTVIDFEDMWLNPTDEQHSASNSYATRTLLANLRSWMVRVKDKVEYKVYRELFPNCIEVIVLRFFILFREILAQKNGPPLRVEDIQKLKMDIEIMSSMLEDICEHDGDATANDGLDNDLRSTSNAHSNNTNGYWVKNINASTDETRPKPLAPKSIADCVKDVLLFFHTMVMLLSEPINSTQFNASLTWLLQEYEHVYHANHPPYFVEFLLVHVILPLRPQAATETELFLSTYHQQAMLVPPHPVETANTVNDIANNSNNNNSSSSGKRKPRRNLDQHDLYWRIFGNNKLFDAIAESYYETTGSSAAASAASGTDKGGAFKFLSPALTTKRLNFSATAAVSSSGTGSAAGGTSAATAGGATTAAGGGGASLMRFKNILPLPKAPTGDLFKPLREKAADLRVFHNQRRQNEDILSILRLLGLGGSGPEEVNGSDTAAAGGSGTGVASASAKAKTSTTGKNDDHEDKLGDLPASSMTSKVINLVASVTGAGGSSSHLIPANTHGTTYNGFIRISHIEVRKLHSAALFGECHPYIYFTLGEQRQKTSVKPNCHTATWDEVLALKVPTNLDLTTATLSVEVFDKELIRRKRLLGEVSIKLDGLDMRDFDSWFALEGGECAGVGEIHVKISLQKLNT